MAASQLLPSPPCQRFFHLKRSGDVGVGGAVPRVRYRPCVEPNASRLGLLTSLRGFLGAYAKDVLAKTRCSSGEKSGSSSVSPVGELGRFWEVEKPDVCMDELNDFEKQLDDFFFNVKSMIKAGRRDDAIELLQANYEAVKEQIQDGTRCIEQAAMLDVIALGYMAVGNSEIVEHILEMLSDIMGCITNGKPLVDSILIHMGSMYTNLGKLEEAKHVYGRGLEILEHSFGSESPFLVTPLLGMAKVFKISGRITEAIDVYCRTIAILETSRGPMSEDLVLPLFGVGNLFINEGRAADAKASFSRILSIYRQIHGEDDGKVGMAMCCLAHANCAEGNIGEAVRLYKNGLQIVKDSNCMDLQHDVLEKMKIDLAELLHVAGRENEGRELLEECLLVTERYKGCEDPSSVAHLVNLATSYSRSKNFVEAERLLRTSLQILSRTVGLKDQAITVPMLHLAVVLYHLKRDEEAERLVLEALHIREDAFGKQSLPVGEALDCLVSIQARLGKDDSEILAHLRRVLAIQEEEFGFESEEVTATLKKVIFYLDKMGKRDEKMPLQRRLSMLRTKYKYMVPF
uniref:Nephrocystin-3 n=2 Tax=Anthurium amnicola TaxID=1678845 RepID=A0A1D1XP72_9ARAE